MTRQEVWDQYMIAILSSKYLGSYNDITKAAALFADQALVHRDQRWGQIDLEEKEDNGTS